MGNSDEDGFYPGHLWKRKNKLGSNSPTAMLNKDGKLIISSDGHHETLVRYLTDPV